MSESFEPANSDVLALGVDLLRGVKALGTQRSEEALLLGTSLTAVGEVGRRRGRGRNSRDRWRGGGVHGGLRAGGGGGGG